jgi:hypothetical protein
LPAASASIKRALRRSASRSTKAKGGVAASNAAS